MIPPDRLCPRQVHMTQPNRMTLSKASARRGFLAAGFLCFAFASLAGAAEAVSFAASDGGKVYADADPADGHAKATILLFHQAGSNRAEDAPIAPKLAAMEFN